MNILDTIIDFKKSDVRNRKSEIKFSELEKRKFFSEESLSLKKVLRVEKKTGIIAEFKRRSPSKGIINDKVVIEKVAKAYELNGAAGISVLTDQEFFGGSDEDFLKVKETVDIPLLRKDFIIDEYQVVESKSIGADVILLIASCLTPAEVKKLAGAAKNLGMEILLELHEVKELDHISDAVTMIGINNRNLKNFGVDTEQSLRLGEKIPADFLKIAESGINSVDMIHLFREKGFLGFLIGEFFMKEADPGEAFKTLQTSLKGGLL